MTKYNLLTRSVYTLFPGIRFFSSTGSPPLKEHCIRIRTCRNVYSKLGDKRPFIFRKCSPSGIDLDLKYVDSQPSSKDAATVLAVHGAPGSYHDYDSILPVLAAYGVRVLCCNMPGFDFTLKTGTFRHTTEEKAELLHDWLSAIGVNRIDVAVMHSSACYPTLDLWHSNPGFIKSLVLLNPAGHRTMQIMKPDWLSNLLVKSNCTLTGHRIFKSLGGFRLFFKSMNNPADPLNLVQAGTTMYYADKGKMIPLLRSIRDLKTPNVYFYGDSDKLVGRKAFEEMLNELTPYHPSAESVVDGSGSIVKHAENDLNNNWLRAFRVAGGGHYAYKSCSKLLVDEITRLISLVHNNDSMR